MPSARWIPKHTRNCAVCGNVFPAYPSSTNICCSKVCSCEHRRRLLLANPIKLSVEGRAKMVATGLATRTKPLGPDMSTLLRHYRKAGLLPDGSPKPPPPKKARARPTTSYTCVICGTGFLAFPSDKKKCCSAGCVSELKRRNKTGKAHLISPAGRERIVAALTTPENLEALAERRRQALVATKNSPIAGPFPTNRMAREWVLLSPDAEVFQFRNMNHFCRERFGVEWESWAKGLRAMVYAVEGHGRWKVDSYRGWRVP